MDREQIEREIKSEVKFFCRALKTYKLSQKDLFQLIQQHFETEFPRIKLMYIEKYEDGTTPPE